MAAEPDDAHKKPGSVALPASARAPRLDPIKEPPSDGWDAGQTYEDFMGRWSRAVAVEFVRWLNPAPDQHWLDVGTGTGALATAITRGAAPASVVGCDPSSAFIEAARGALDDPRVTFVVGGVGDLPSRDGGKDIVVFGLALNFFPDADAAVEEQVGAARSGAVIGAYVWDYAEGMEFLRHFWDAAIAVVAEAESVDEGRRFPICRPEALEARFEGAGLEGVRVAAIRVPTEFADFEDYWSPFLGGTGPAPSFVDGLSVGQRQRLANDLRARLPTHAGGQIELRARAWAVAGTAR